MMMLAAFLMLAAPAFSISPENILILNLQYDNGKIMITGMEAAQGFYPQPEYANDYLTYDVYDESNNRIMTASYKFTPSIHVDYWGMNGRRGGIITRDNFNFSVILPYRDGSAKIAVKDKQGNLLQEAIISEGIRKEIAEKPAVVAALAEEMPQCSPIKDGYCNQSCYGDLDCACGDGICEYHENYLTCPQDCMIEDYTCMYISDNHCDTNCPVLDVDCPADYNSPGYIEASARMSALEIMLIAVLVVLIVTLAYIYMLTKR